MTSWHNNTDLPPEDADCMVVIKNMFDELRMCEAFFNRTRLIFMVGRDLLNFNPLHIERWAYYDDLIKEAMK